MPYQRNRVLPGRDLGETPFNITTPRYDEYYRGILVFPRWCSSARQKPFPNANRKRGGYTEDYTLGSAECPRRGVGASPSGNADIDYLSKVPFRSYRPLSPPQPFKRSLRGSVFLCPEPPPQAHCCQKMLTPGVLAP